MKSLRRRSHGGHIVMINGNSSSSSSNGNSNGNGRRYSESQCRRDSKGSGALRRGSNVKFGMLGFKQAFLDDDSIPAASPSVSPTPSPAALPAADSDPVYNFTTVERVQQLRSDPFLQSVLAEEVSKAGVVTALGYHAVYQKFLFSETVESRLMEEAMARQQRAAEEEQLRGDLRSKMKKKRSFKRTSKRFLHGLANSLPAVDLTFDIEADDTITGQPVMIAGQNFRQNSNGSSNSGFCGFGEAPNNNLFAYVIPSFPMKMILCSKSDSQHETEDEEANLAPRRTSIMLTPKEKEKLMREQQEFLKMKIQSEMKDSFLMSFKSEGEDSHNESINGNKDSDNDNSCENNPSVDRSDDEEDTEEEIDLVLSMKQIMLTARPIMRPPISSNTTRPPMRPTQVQVVSKPSASTPTSVSIRPKMRPTRENVSSRRMATKLDSEPTLNQILGPKDDITNCPPSKHRRSSKQRRSKMEHDFHSLQDSNVSAASVVSIQSLELEDVFDGNEGAKCFAPPYSIDDQEGSFGTVGSDSGLDNDDDDNSIGHEDEFEFKNSFDHCPERLTLNDNDKNVQDQDQETHQEEPLKNSEYSVFTESNMDECGFLPWPEKKARKSNNESSNNLADEDIDHSSHSIQPSLEPSEQHEDGAFLPWPSVEKRYLRVVHAARRTTSGAATSSLARRAFAA